MSREEALRILNDEMSESTHAHIKKINHLESWIVDAMIEYAESQIVENDEKKFLAIGTLGSGKSFRYMETAKTMKMFVSYINEIYPDFDIDAVIEVS